MLSRTAQLLLVQSRHRRVMLIATCLKVHHCVTDSQVSCCVISCYFPGQVINANVNHHGPVPKVLPFAEKTCLYQHQQHRVKVQNANVQPAALGSLTSMQPCLRQYTN